ncbi:MAG: SDR family NAD(P)-dependent oxidoreductase [Myxococcales bacterium]|nr:SDR family NAD(P)-dependent oxidoreductase [Myxococcales bacterium]
MPRPRLEHVVITGAAGAIGGAVAAQLAARHPGVRLELIDVDDAGLARAAATVADARTWRWDLARPAELPARWDELIAAGGPVDGLVNCAGIMDVRSVAGTPWDVAQRILDIDLTSPLRLMSLAAPTMAARGRGVLINVASMAGRVPLRGCAYYGGAKAGLAMASEIAHLELAPAGVHVVTVYPGPVASALERNARAQLKPSLIARLLPMGDAARMAELIAIAVERGQPRVVYPPIYAAADRAIGVATWITRRFSPTPAA